MPKVQKLHKQSPRTKITLQLFPVNEIARRELEKCGYNPFLELTLSARKKISSIIRHLDTKWGNSSAAVGQIVLFPYTVKPEQISSCRGWTSNDSAVTAWDVYLALKTPSLFRLRYGWRSNSHLETGDIPPKSFPPENCIDSAGINTTCSRDLEIRHADKTLDTDHEAGGLQSDVKELSGLDVPNDHVSTIPWDDNFTNLSIGCLLAEISLMGKINGSPANNAKESTMLPTGQTSNATMVGFLSEPSLQHKINSSDIPPKNKSTLQPILLTASDISIGGLLSESFLLPNKRKLDTQFQSPWDDTNLSIGGLFSEASLQAKGGCKSEAKECTLLDSFDAFMAEISLMGKINGSPANNAKESTMLPTGQTSNATMVGFLSEPSLQHKINSSDIPPENKSTLQPILLTASDISIGGLLSESSLLPNKRKLDTQFQSPWDDTNLSIGGLFSEASLQAKGGCKSEAKECTLLDSFDAFMAAHFNAGSQMLKPDTCHGSGSSFLDAEDTCHAFPFQKFQPPNSTNRYSTSTGLQPFQFPKVAKTCISTGFTNNISSQQVKGNPSHLGCLEP